MDPDSGELVAMVADEEGFRPLQAHEVAMEITASAATPISHVPGASLQTALIVATDWAHASLDAFLRHENSYPTEEASEWDSDSCLAPGM